MLAPYAAALIHYTMASRAPKLEFIEAKAPGMGFWLTWGFAFGLNPFDVDVDFDVVGSSESASASFLNVVDEQSRSE